MGKVTGFLEIPREERAYRPVDERVKNFGEFVVELSEQQLAEQGARCMDCGIPYCHTGCPVNNLIPDWNDLVYRADWQSASEVLHSTNNFPEFTGRICPAPCETACTLYLDDQPVTIKTIEHAIVERAWKEGWIQPQPPTHKSTKRVAVVGAGPAGLACAQQLARAGHNVILYDKQERSGGLLRYGIPDFKLDKRIIDRRMAQLEAEGVEFHGNTRIGTHGGTHGGVNIPVADLIANFDAIALTGGAEHPRDLPVAGRNLAGVHFAMDYLRSNTRRVTDERVTKNSHGGKYEHDYEHDHEHEHDHEFIDAHGKHIVVIGGGDTGSDCIGTAARQGAASITQIEILSQPPTSENKAIIWPNWPHKLRTSSSQEEGCTRIWDVVTKAFVADDAGRLAHVRCMKVAWNNDHGEWKMKEIAGSEFELPAGLATLAMGFLHPLHSGMLTDLGVRLNARGNVEAAEQGTHAYQTNINKIFTGGDMRRGQSLVVWAIREGRQCAYAVDKYLCGHSELPV